MTAAERIEALVPKDDFLRATEVAHLCAGGETPVLRSHLAVIERLTAAMDERTRVLAVSQVSYLTGRRYRLEDLAALARRAGALLSVDATHATGVVPVAARHADVLVSSCYKFLLGVHGAAIFYRNPERLADLAPQTIG